MRWMRRWEVSAGLALLLGSCAGFSDEALAVEFDQTVFGHRVSVGKSDKGEVAQGRRTGAA